ncbi:hypothetical protein BGW39_006762 [Mortierella sp. 14UC]|nr:hypothetical protein BGW39_006762 [Mortierella sp. 14UC]
MAASKDRKGATPSAPILEEEQATFGQQPPYAAGFNDNDPAASSSAYFPITSPSIHSPVRSQPSTVTSPQQSIPATAAPSAIPLFQQDAQHYPEDDQPPAYDEVARPVGAPHNYYGNNNSQGYNNPTAPLLPSGPPGNSYSAIPPATPYTPESPSSIYGGSDDSSRRFNKFWIIFLAVVVFLSITVDDDNGADNGECGVGFTRSIISQSIPISINNLEITADGIATTVILETMEHGGDEPDKVQVRIFATGRDRDDLRRVIKGSNVDPARSLLRMMISREGDAAPNDCMSAVIRLSIPPSMEIIERLKIFVDEGNVTLAMRRPWLPFQIKDLNTKVVTGYTRVDARVASMQLGGSVGIIEGNVETGPSMTVLMVDGSVSLNVTQFTPVLDGKVTVTNGNIDVGLLTPYVGTFRLEAGSGLVQVHHADFEKTKVKYESNRAAKGWRTETGSEPRGRVSSLKLTTHSGLAELDMARQIDP